MRRKAQRDGKRDGHGELRVEPPRRAGEEGDRHEHGDEHERGGDDRAKDLAHRVGRRLARRHLEFLDVPLDSSLMMRSTFSMTTIASSTTMPVARIRPKSVNVLMEKSISLMKPNAPMSDTGIVIAGISVLRQRCMQ